MSPTQLTLKQLRADGWLAAVTEHWNPWSKVRVDLYGFCDILAIKGDISLWIQCTTAAHINARIEKMKCLPAVGALHCPPTRFVEIWGWSKKGPRGKRKVWEVRKVHWSNVLYD